MNTTTQTLADIKATKETKVSDLITSCSMFFAFSNEQFAANKTPLQEGDKYVHIGAGSYLPKSKVDTFLDGMKAINKWYKGALKAGKQRKANILYELLNHEAYYTNDITDTLEALGSDYTRTEVLAVYKANYKKQMENC